MSSPGSANPTQTRLTAPSFVRRPFTTARNTTTNWPGGSDRLIVSPRRRSPTLGMSKSGPLRASTREGGFESVRRPSPHANVLMRIHDGNVLLYKKCQDTLHVYDYVSE